MATAEHARLLEVPKGRSPWRPRGLSLSERGWGTVRKGYGATGDTGTFPHMRQAGHDSSRT